MKEPSDDSEPWSEYRRLVIEGLEAINKRLDRIEVTQHAQAVTIAVERVKMSLVGAISGALVGGLVAAVVRWIAP